MSRLKKIIIFVIIILILVLTFLYTRKPSQPQYNDENEVGNTAGNLFNGGLFSELNENIYFSNPKDNDSLYVMDLEGKNFKKLSSDTVSYINAIGNYIYYVRMNAIKNGTSSVFSFSNVGIYRVNLKGSGIKMLYENPSGLVNVSGNTVYYQHFMEEEGLTFYSVSITGSDEKLVSKEPIIPISIEEATLYYAGAGEDHSINKMNLHTGAITSIYNDNCYAPIVNNNYIFYMSLSNNYAIYRINKDGTNPIPIVNERCSTYNITADGKYLYYQVDDAVNNRICIMNIQSGESSTIMEGNFNQIHITSNYVFYTGLLDSNTYYMSIGSSNGVSVFNPPDLSKK